MSMGLHTCMILLLIFYVGQGPLQMACKLQGWKQKVYSRKGDILIGGVFVVHSEFTFPKLTFEEEPQTISCAGFHIRYYRDVLAMVFAIEEINRTPGLLPNSTLGFWILDSCMSQTRTLRGILELLSGKKSPVPGYSCHPRYMPAGVVGELMSSISVPMARILGLYHFPQISYGSSLSTLSDKLQFPSFLRTVSGNTLQIIALAQLLRHFGWTWIGIVTSDDDIGVQGGQDIKKGIEKNGGCVAYMDKIHLSYTMEKILIVVEKIRDYTVKVVIIHSSEVHTKMFMETLASQNVTDRVWVFSDAFTLTPGLFRKEAWKIFNGSLALSPHATDMPEFEQVLYRLQPSSAPDDIFIKLFWGKVFNCKWPELNKTGAPATEDHGKRLAACSEDQALDTLDMSFFELNDLSYTYHTYLAVYAFANALHSLMSCKPGQGPFINGTCAEINDIRPWQVTVSGISLVHYI